MRVGPLLALSLLLLGARSVRAADPPRTYLREPDGEEDGVVAGLVGSLESRAGDDAIANVVDRLLEEARSPLRQGLLIAVPEAPPGAPPDPRRPRAPGPQRCWRGLAAFAIDQGLGLPPAAEQALRALQDRAAGRVVAPEPAALMARYPFARRSADAALALASRAAASGDLPLVRRHLAWLALLHPDVAASSAPALSLAAFAAADLGDAVAAERSMRALRDLPGPGGEARLASAARLVESALARPRATLEAPPLTARAVERWWSASARVADEMPWSIVVPRALPWAPDAEPADMRVVASNGASAVVLDGTGRVLGRVPVSPGTSGAPPSARTRFVSRIAAHGEQAFLPLVLEGWLAPGRTEGGGDASFAGRFYSLCGLDPSGRLAWWDGDPGAVQDPMRAQVAQGHVIAVAADGARVVAVQVMKADEPALQLIVWAREGGARQAISLRPLSLTPLFTSERPIDAGGSDAPVAPELAAALHLDGAGKAVITTDASIACQVDLATGELDWLVRVPTNRAAQRLPARFRPQESEEESLGAVPEPARPLGADRLVVILAGGAHALARQDGRLLWSAKPEVDRAQVVDRWVVASGQRLWLLDPDSGQAVDAGQAAGQGLFGESAVLGRSLFVPQLQGGLGGACLLRRYDLGEGTPPALVQRGVWPLNGHKGGAAVVPIPGGLLVGSNARVSWYDWR